VCVGAIAVAVSCRRVSSISFYASGAVGLKTGYLKIRRYLNAKFENLSLVQESAQVLGRDAVDQIADGAGQR
jgi:hypothetical protein